MVQNMVSCSNEAYNHQKTMRHFAQISMPIQLRRTYADNFLHNAALPTSHCFNNMTMPHNASILSLFYILKYIVLSQYDEKVPVIHL